MIALHPPPSPTHPLSLSSLSASRLSPREKLPHIKLALRPPLASLHRIPPRRPAPRRTSKSGVPSSKSEPPSKSESGSSESWPTWANVHALSSMRDCIECLLDEHDLFESCSEPSEIQRTKWFSNGDEEGRGRKPRTKAEAQKRQAVAKMRRYRDAKASRRAKRRTRKYPRAPMFKPSLAAVLE